MSKNRPTMSLQPAATAPEPSVDQAAIDAAAAAAAAAEAAEQARKEQEEAAAEQARKEQEEAAAEQARKEQEEAAEAARQKEADEAAAAREAEEQAAALAAANQGTTPEAPADAVKAQAQAWKIGDVVELVIVYSQPLHHLHTGVVFGVEPVAAEIDAFVAAQLDAGKLAIAPSAT